MTTKKKVDKSKQKIPIKIPTPAIVPSKSSGLETTGPVPLIPDEVLQQLNTKINEKLKAAEISRKKNELSAAEFKVLELIVSEYLKSFIIIGYTLDGHKIRIGHAPTPQDHDALVEHLRSTFMQTIGEI